MGSADFRAVGRVPVVCVVRRAGWNEGGGVLGDRLGPAVVIGERAIPQTDPPAARCKIRKAVVAVPGGGGRWSVPG